MRAALVPSAHRGAGVVRHEVPLAVRLRTLRERAPERGKALGAQRALVGAREPRELQGARLRCEGQQPARADGLALPQPVLERAQRRREAGRVVVVEEAREPLRWRPAEGA